MGEVSISVIIPIFNGEEYIGRLVSMLEQQSFKDFEVIFVDDGSTDRSAEMLDSLKSSSELLVGSVPNVPLRSALESPVGMSSRSSLESPVRTPLCSLLSVQIVSQENSGQGAARNAGLKCARGRYVAFIDQDDSIKADYLEKLFEVVSVDNENSKEMDAAIDSAIDVVLSGYCMTDTEGRVIRRIPLSNTYWDRFICIAPWGKLYRREFLKENDIKFLPVVLGEDIYFNADVYAAGAICQSTEYVGYEWVQNRNSVSHTRHRKVSDEASLFPLYNMIVDNERTKAYLENEYFEYFMVKTAVYHIMKSFGGTRLGSLLDYRRALRKWLRTSCGDYYKNRLFSLSLPEGESGLVRLIVWIWVKIKLV